MKRLSAILWLVVFSLACSTGLVSSTVSLNGQTFTRLDDDGGNSSDGGTTTGGATDPTQLKPPSLSSIKSSLLANNTYGMRVGATLGAITLPSCTDGNGDALTFSVSYTMTGLPTWLSFDGSSMSISLNAVSTVPSDSFTISEVTLQCTSDSDSSLSAFRTFNINDVDQESIGDAREFLHGAVPILGKEGYLGTNPIENALLPRRPTGISITTSFMGVNDASDASADFDGDSISNADEISNGTNPFVATANATYGTKQTFTTRTAPTAVSVAKLNSDNFLDLVVSNIGGGGADDQVSVFLGDGDGTFDGTARRDFTVGVGSFIHVIGDVNGDGNMDLVSADWNSGVGTTISLLLGNGDGTFEARSTLTTSSGPWDLTLGDLDGDGDLDIAVACDSTEAADSVTIHLNNGSGTFGSGTVLSTSSEPFGIATGDVDGDGDLDLIVTNNTANVFSVYLGAGDGTFADAVTYSTGGAHTPGYIILGDLDNDRDLDLAMADTDNHEILVTFGNGDGTFEDIGGANFATYSVGGNSGNNTLSLADLDGDGDLDLAMPRHGSDNIALFLNNGSGVFTETTSPSVGDGPGSIAVGDVNNDGKLDMVTVDFGAQDGTTGAAILGQ